MGKMGKESRGLVCLVVVLHLIVVRSGIDERAALSASIEGGSGALGTSLASGRLDGTSAESGASGASGESGDDDADDGSTASENKAIGLLHIQQAALRTAQDLMTKVVAKLRKAKETASGVQQKLTNGFKEMDSHLSISAESTSTKDYQMSLTQLVKMVHKAHEVHDGITKAARAYKAVQKLVGKSDGLQRDVVQIRDHGVRMCHHAVERTAVHANIAKRAARLADLEVQRAREVIVSKLALAHESSLKANTPGLNAALIRTFLAESVRTTNEADKSRKELNRIIKKQNDDDGRADKLMNQAHDIADECATFYKSAGLDADQGSKGRPTQQPIDAPANQGVGQDGQSRGDVYPRFKGVATSFVNPTDSPTDSMDIADSV